MSDLKENKIYLFHSGRFDSLLLFIHKKYGLFSELATTWKTPSNGYLKLSEQMQKHLIKEVDLKDLPLYIGWPNKHSKFTDLLKAGLNE